MPNTELKAGAAALDITPPLGCSLAGHMADRSATHVHDPLQVKCLALNNGISQLLLVLCDLIAIKRDQADKARHKIHSHTKVPLTSILISATHTHTAITPVSVFQSDPDPRYLDWLVVRIADAARCAVANLRPARIGWTVGSEPSMVFNRRFFMKPGTIPPGPFEPTTDQVKMNPGQENPDIVGPAGPVDPDISLIAVQHADGRPLALYGNYALHYVGGDPGNEISADYFAVWAAAMARRVGCPAGEWEGRYPPFVAMLTNGCSGDINNIDVRKKTQQPHPYHRMREVAEAVAASSFKALSGIRYHEHVSLAATERLLEMGVRKPSAREISRARAILGKAGPQLRTLEEIYARETVLMEDWPERWSSPVQALRIGELGIATFPGEAFVEMGLEVKKNSPLKPTLCVELANDYAGYIPTARHYALGGYETWRARSSFLAEGSAELLVAAALELLAGLAAS